MKLSRLFQPRNPLFWIMMALNALSMVLGWLLRVQPLSTPVMLMVGGFGLANAVLGMWMAWRLVQSPPAQA
jgi:uncharacterized membrane protein HdeD (DUF308 family)